MADWVDINDTQLDPDAPLTSQLAYAWRDNPIAITEGASGAPRIVGGAIARVEDFPVLTVTASNDFDIGVAASVVGGVPFINSPSTSDAFTVTIVRVTGSVKFRATHSVGGTGGSASIQILKNGSSIQSWSLTPGSSDERIIDVPVVPGDEIVWRHSVSGAATSAVGGIRQTATDGYATISPIIKASDV